MSRETADLLARTGIDQQDCSRGLANSQDVLAGGPSHCAHILPVLGERSHHRPRLSIPDQDFAADSCETVPSRGPRYVVDPVKVRLEDLLAHGRERIPYPHRPIAPARGEAPPLATPGDGEGLVRMTPEG